MMSKSAAVSDSERVKRAIEMAEKAHEGQFRKTGEPYINPYGEIILSKFQESGTSKLNL